MADSSLKVVIDQTDALNFMGADMTRNQMLRKLARHIMEFAGGNKRGNALYVWPDGAAPRLAYQTVTFATASGTVGLIINGVTVSVTWGTSDTASMTALVAAINASTNALVQYLVQACNLKGTITCASVAAGDKVSILGYDFTAVAGGTLAGDQFDQSGTDTQDAASLVTQINNRAGLNQLVVADSSAGVVTVRQLAGTSAAGSIKSAAATMTIVDFAASTVGCVSALHLGIVGNCITTAATGTGVTAGGARLTGGTGGNVSPMKVQL